MHDEEENDTFFSWKARHYFVIMKIIVVNIQLGSFFISIITFKESIRCVSGDFFVFFTGRPA